MNKIKMTALFVLLIAGLAFSKVGLGFTFTTGDTTQTFFISVTLKGTFNKNSDTTIKCSGSSGTQRGAARVDTNWQGTAFIKAEGYLSDTIKNLYITGDKNLKVTLIKIPSTTISPLKLNKKTAPLTIINNSFTVEAGSYEIAAFNLAGQLIFQKKACATTNYTGLLPLVSNNTYVVCLKQGNNSIVKRIQIVN